MLPGRNHLSTRLPSFGFDELEQSDTPILCNSNDPRLTPAFHYNAMINPIKNFKFKAVLWYQRERQPKNYDKGLEKLIRIWRGNFNSPNMGFVVFTLF